ncbi:MAG: tripartite tricarboxylate transporter substrate-binding protein [Alphaproteobacteria bacterium]|nr:tripartite tricarboxylate transporter substrate-binding protein [Alphaproteobacteria bacterium]
MLRRHLLRTLAAVLTALSAQAQTAWPSQPIKVINPFPTGGTVDQITRLLQPHLQQNLGQAIVVENRVGASGSIGTGLVAKAPADGNTWVMVFDTHGVNPSLYPNLPFDT